MKDGLMAISVEEVARKLEARTMKGAEPNPGLAPYFGQGTTSTDMPMMSFTSCVEHEHICHAAISPDGMIQIVTGQEADGSWSISEQGTIESSLGAVLELGPGMIAEAQGVVGPEEAARINAAAKGIPQEEADGSDLPGFYL